MNTNKLKPFAQKARKILIEGVEKRILYWGFDKKGNVVEEPQKVQGGTVMRGKVIDDESLYSKWRSLKVAVNQMGVREVAEEAAYTWFNRLLAIKILGKNGYDPEQLAFESETLKVPLIISRARKGQTNFLTPEENKRLQLRLPDFEKDDESFGILLLAYCHAHPLIHHVFGRADDYTELLLPDNILSEQGFLHLLNTAEAITDDDFRQVELIGWLYQFYISERKDEVFKAFKSNKKAEAKDIPAATQIFTPNWIVKYMTQNTVGKLWLEKEPNSPLRQQMKYLVEAEDAQEEVKPIFEGIEQLKLLDPAVGSGHILVEAFQLLFEMYMEEMYTEREAVESILQNNLFGLDIDLRAVQLARFAVLLIAAQKHKDILRSGMMPHIYAMPARAEFTNYEIQDFLGKEGLQYQGALTQTLELMQQAQNLGSMMQFELTDKCRDFLLQRHDELEAKQDKTFGELAVLPKIKPYLEVLGVLTDKYGSVVANPPYMGTKSMNNDLKKYVEKNYPASKADLMTVFMEVLPNLTRNEGRFSMINLPSWLFLSSFQKLREIYISTYSINSLLHMGRGIFGIDFGSVAFSTKKYKSQNAKGTYFKLHERNFQHIYYKDIEKLFLYSKFHKSYLFDFSKYRDENGISEIAKEGHENGLKLCYPNFVQSNFSKIPGSPIAYWVSKKVINAFEIATPLSEISEAREGLATGNNSLYVRGWYEVEQKKIFFHSKNRKDAIKSRAKWFPYNKGGDLRKWYGNHHNVVNWENDGYLLRNTFHPDGKRIWAHNFNLEYIFKPQISWSDITSKGLSLRYFPEGFLFDATGLCTFFDNEEHAYYTLGLLNTKFGDEIAKLLNPTMHFKSGDFRKVPAIIDENNFSTIVNLVKELIVISKEDWDSSELSWNFQTSPILISKSTNLKGSFDSYVGHIEDKVFQFHSNEKDINKFFIDTYGLKQEISPVVPLKDITIFQEELDRKKLKDVESSFREGGRQAIILPIKEDVVMQQLISYAVGCMMGRYRLDIPGLHIAHPNPTAEEVCTYTYNGKEFNIDEDAIIPLMGSGSNFPDDAVNRFRNFLEVVWGEDTLTENLNFLQTCLDQDLEKYMVRDFWKDHCRRYKKKPIYWLFASPTNAFQVLVYMHRMSPYTVDTIRSKYLLPHMQYLQNAIDRMEANAANLNAGEQRHLDKLRAQLQECQEYDLHLKDIADRQIKIDLDDGVAVNYPKFEPVVAPIK